MFPTALAPSRLTLILTTLLALGPSSRTPVASCRGDSLGAENAQEDRRGLF